MDKQDINWAFNYMEDRINDLNAENNAIGGMVTEWSEEDLKAVKILHEYLAVKEGWVQ